MFHQPPSGAGSAHRKLVGPHGAFSCEAIMMVEGRSAELTDWDCIPARRPDVVRVSKGPLCRPARCRSLARYGRSPKLDRPAIPIGDWPSATSVTRLNLGVRRRRPDASHPPARPSSMPSAINGRSPARCRHFEALNSYAARPDSATSMSWANRVKLVRPHAKPLLKQASRSTRAAPRAATRPLLGRLGRSLEGLHRIVRLIVPSSFANPRPRGPSG